MVQPVANKVAAHRNPVGTACSLVRYRRPSCRHSVYPSDLGVANYLIEEICRRKYNQPEFGRSIVVAMGIATCSLSRDDHAPVPGDGRTERNTTSESEDGRVTFPSTFHDALIEEMTAGPRKELAIVLRTVNPPSPGNRYRVRFGAIDNYAVVVKTLEGIQADSENGAYVGRVDQMHVLNEAAPARDLTEVEIKIDHWEPFVIKCRKISISKEAS